MILTAWRIVREGRAADAFSGEGARQWGGRWNSPGTAVVYTSEHQSLAALENLVHLTPRAPWRFKVFRVQFDESLIERLPRSALATGWRSSPPDSSTMRLGDRWVREGRTAVLVMPSAIIPDENSFLLNPRHSDFGRIGVGQPTDFAFDSRLME